MSIKIIKVDLFDAITFLSERTLLKKIQELCFIDLQYIQVSLNCLMEMNVIHNLLTFDVSSNNVNKLFNASPTLPPVVIGANIEL